MRYSVFKELFPTASAGTIMNEFEMRRKVRCHSGGLWKIDRSKSPVSAKGAEARTGQPRLVSEPKGWASPLFKLA